MTRTREELMALRCPMSMAHRDGPDRCMGPKCAAYGESAQGRIIGAPVETITLKIGEASELTSAPEGFRWCAGQRGGPDQNWELRKYERFAFCRMMHS